VRRLEAGAHLAAVTLVAVALAAWTAACSGERYARPAGPAPRYEEAPVLAWDGGTAPVEPVVEHSPTRPQAVARLAARSAILERAVRATNERQDNRNDSDD
jgi:hypothetical protein